ncbi:MAG: magnesium transporter [Gammaproteobacteria bacterium]
MTDDKKNELKRALEVELFAHHPQEAVSLLESMDAESIGQMLNAHDAVTTGNVLEALSPAMAADVVSCLGTSQIIEAFNQMQVTRVAGILRIIAEPLRTELRNGIDTRLQADVDLLLSCPKGSAGAAMDPRVIHLRQNLSVAEAIARIRAEGRHRGAARARRVLVVVDQFGKLEGVVAVQDLVLADESDSLSMYLQAAPAFVSITASTDEMVDMFERHALSSLPVVDESGYLVGVVRYEQLMSAAQEIASVDLQTVFGVSRDEKALSKPLFAVKKRLPWLQINLLTAFLAAAVVGIFESTIATFTALAVLLPVVAGQSGNTGAQALSVVIRGLALREISSAHWRRVVWKETLVAAINGLAVAATTALAVFVWSSSFGLTLVIAISMVISMGIAGASGAAIPLLLNRLGQDPAQSSSILLTTVTDVAGFFSFLGIASLFITML